MPHIDGFTPPDPRSRLDHLGTYARTMPVTLERMFENALDWEHLPHVHDESFRSIECLESGPWGWRASVGIGIGIGIGIGTQQTVIELSLDRDARRWISRTLEGRGAGAEIWTHALVLGPSQLRVVVDFFLPGIAAEDRARLGEGYARLYHRLYDEDEAMMVERMRALGVPRAEAAEGQEIDLGPLTSLPAVVQTDGLRWRLVELDGALLAFDTRCPHQLGPLDDAAVNDGIVRCPWHGYDFDLRSGRCISGASCRIRPRPVTIRDGRAWITLSP